MKKTVLLFFILFSVWIPAVGASTVQELIDSGECGDMFILDCIIEKGNTYDTYRIIHYVPGVGYTESNEYGRIVMSSPFTAKFRTFRTVIADGVVISHDYKHTTIYDTETGEIWMIKKERRP